MSDNTRIGALVQNAQPYFTINRDENGVRTDGFMKATGKVVTRVPANLTLAAASLIQTVVSAALTVLTAVLYPITSRPMNYFADTTKLAGRAVVESLKGTVGSSTVEGKKEVKVAPAPQLTRTQKAMKLAKAAANFVWTNKGPAAQYIYRNKFKIAAGVAFTYFVGVPAAKALYAAGKSAVTTFGTDVADKAVDAASRTYTAGAFVGSKVATGASKVWNMLPNFRSAKFEQPTCPVGSFNPAMETCPANYTN